jgi:hypothetical protein
MNPEWNLHLFRVVIDDGYPEHHVGDVFEWFAIVFWSDAALIRSTEKTKAALPIANNYYRVNAEVIYISQDPKQAACILDFGIKAISESGGILGVPLPPGCQEGDYVTGEIRLELPLCTDVHPHDLAHRWRVNRISADLTNFSSYPGDVSEVRYLDVVGTDSVRAGSYVLHCSNLNA